MLPPGVQKSWDDCTSRIKAEILSYDNIRHEEEMKWEAALAGAGE